MEKRPRARRLNGIARRRLLRTARSSDFAWSAAAADASGGPKRARPMLATSAARVHPGPLAHVLTEVCERQRSGDRDPDVQRGSRRAPAGTRWRSPAGRCSGSDGAVRGPSRSRRAGRAPQPRGRRSARCPRPGPPSRSPRPLATSPPVAPAAPGPDWPGCPSTPPSTPAAMALSFSTCSRAGGRRRRATTPCTLCAEPPAAGRRVERQPPVAVEPDLDPGVRIPCRRLVQNKAPRVPRRSLRW